MSNKKYSITLNGVAHEVIIAPQGSDNYAVTVDGELFNVTATTLSLENISNHIVGLSENSFVYTGEEIRPTVLTDGTVTEGIDYNVTDLYSAFSNSRLSAIPPIHIRGKVDVNRAFSGCVNLTQLPTFI